MEDNETIDPGGQPKRGHLKIFFGACAGVGKTYAMLNDARNRRLKDGLDVFTGIVETHGRDEVVKLMLDIPGFALQTLHRRGITLKEFDLDSVLARRPALVLIDELAHTNVPGARHPKRWQDVEELLAAGISVYTTLNVQHLESLNDIVANITGIRVRETVPDTMFDNADDIALIDIPPDEILNRLNEGKVYLAPEVKKRAIEHFFRKSNLIALRELALRRAAERVNAQRASYNSGQNRKEPGIAEKILVCTGYDAFSTHVIRHAKRIATKSHSPWVAVYVETGRHFRLSAAEREGINHNLQLAEKMGAKTRILKGSDVAEEIVAFALDQNVTRIVVGKPHRSHWRDVLCGSLTHKLIGRSQSIEISIVPGVAQGGSAPFFSTPFMTHPHHYAFAAFSVLLCTLISFPLRDHINAANMGMIYLAGVVGIAARFGLWPAIATSLLSIMAFNFFFVEPYYSFNVYDPGYFITFAVMIIISLIVGSLTSRLRLLANFFRERDNRTNVLYGLMKELASISGREAMAEAACAHIRQVFHGTVSVLLPDGNGNMNSFPGNIHSSNVKEAVREATVARWCFDHRQNAGLGTTTMPGSHYLYLPVIADDNCLAVVSITPQHPEEKFNGEEISQLETFCGLLATTLQRANASHAAEEAKVEAEAEKLRNTLLSSVSHDLRTPLASVRGSIEAVLASAKDSLSSEATELLEGAQKQSERLTRMVNDLLAINRLETGKPLLDAQAYYIDEVIGAVISHARPWMGGRMLKTEIPPHLPLIPMDGALVEQLLLNLLENAVKYTPEDGIIRIHAEKEPYCLRVCVSDNGCGIPAGEEHKIFEKFYRVKGNSARQGSGLGLAICKAVVMAHGGSISARNNETGGLTIAFTLPMDSEFSAREE